MSLSITLIPHSFKLQILETTVDADPASITISNKPRGNETPVSTLKGRNLQDLGLRSVDSSIFLCLLILIGADMEI